MFLKSLQIQGFKSFPDKIKLDFRQGVTATVGPNGSGKSNLSDAVRWVLGEQAPSALRIKSMEDIIFEGSETRKAAGFAEVIISIDNSGRWLNFESDEVSVGRRYYRSGTSEYRINGKSVLLREVNELFMDTGIGRDGYSMIGQGKISAIVQAKAQERRVIFEEAAGISKHRYRKAEAEKNLSKTEDNLTHLEVILSGLEERVGPLGQESEKAKKYLELYDELRRGDIGLCLSLLGSSKARLRDMDYKITALNSQCEELEESTASCDSEAEQLYNEGLRLDAEKDGLVRQSGELEESALRLENEASLLDNNASHAQSDILRIEGELKSAGEDEGQLREEIARASLELEKNAAGTAAQLAAMDAVKSQIEALRSGEYDEEAALGELRKRQNELTVSISEHRLAAASAQSQLSEISGRTQSIDKLLEDRQARRGELGAELEETKSILLGINEKAAGLGNSINGYKMRLDKQRAAAENARRLLEEMQLELHKKQNQARMIEDLERSMDGFYGSVRRIMQASAQGALGGIHGPVSSLVSVDSKYATAIEVALGAAVQNIVVDSDTDGKRAVEYLKSNKAGRATFLPISVIKPRCLEEKGLDDCAGFLGVACDLVSCDGRYRDIIDNLLGKTAVCEDMDCAISIARRFGHRFRIVTLDGQVINAGGSMTGGSMSKDTGLLSRRGELEKLAADIEKLREKSAQAEREAQAQKSRSAADEAAFLGAQGELATLGEDRARFEAEIKSLSEQITRSDEEREALLSEKNGSGERVAALEKERQGQLEQAERLSGEADGLEAAILERTGSIDRLSQQREELAERLSEVGLRHMALVKEAEAVNARIAELESRIEQGGSREAELLRQIEAHKSSIAELGEQAKALRGQACALREQASGNGGRISKITLERNELEKKIIEKRRQARESAEQKGAAAAERAKLEERLLQQQREHDGIITRLMEDYDVSLSEAEKNYEPAEDENKARRAVSSLRGKIKALGSVNVGAIEEFKQVSADYNMYKTQIDDVLKAKAELERLITELTGRMQDMFRRTFAEINANFSKIFPELFGGGSAKLVLVDDEDCLNCGIDIIVTQPGKDAPSFTGMSGGQESIIAVAIYFAIMKVRPSPFCFLDEIDHALDERNVVNIARYIKRFSGTTQYFVITHRRGMMESADMLYGVTKQDDGVSRIIQLRLDEIEEKLGKLD